MSRQNVGREMVSRQNVVRRAFSPDEWDAIREAVSYHYLTDLSVYGVPLDELGEDERELHNTLVAVRAKLNRVRP